MKPDQNGSLYALTPFLLFITLFMLSAANYIPSLSSTAAALIALTFSLCTFPTHSSLSTRLKIIIHGATQPTVLSMCAIFIAIALFTTVMQLIGGIQAATALTLSLLSPSIILPGLFIGVSIIATALGSSMGTIAAFLPIGLTIANQLSLDPALLAGIIVSAAMLGDNLSLLSDTTIAATATTGSSMSDKFKENLLLVLPAAFITIVIVYNFNSSMLFMAADTLSAPLTESVEYATLKSLPYLLIFALSLLMNIDGAIVLIIGTICALILGLYVQLISWYAIPQILATSLIANTDLHSLLLLVIGIAALSHVIEYNGGINYLLAQAQRSVVNKASAELVIALLTFIINIAIAINTITILITGPLAKKIGDSQNISGKRVASLLDTVACFCQGILPYSPQLLLAGSLAQVSPLAIIPYLHYQWAIAGVVGASIVATYATNSRN